MLNLFKKKEVITYYEGELSFKEMESRLTTEQTWGTDKKIYRLFFDHLKLKTPVLEFQSILQKQPKKYYLNLLIIISLLNTGITFQAFTTMI